MLITVDTPACAELERFRQSTSIRLFGSVRPVGWSASCFVAGLNAMPGVLHQNNGII